MSDKPVRMSKMAKVRNKAAAPVQITAEQLLREANERQIEYVPPAPKQDIVDPEELAEVKLAQRKNFEENIRRNRSKVSNWTGYAKFEERNGELDRARSVMERALDIDHRNVQFWMCYIEMEMKNKQVNHARNIFDRAVTILPRVSQFWQKYAYFEEIMGNIAGAKQVFKRWMEWCPDEQAWNSFINFLMRYQELDEAVQVYEKYILVHPEPRIWIRYAHFLHRNRQPGTAREVYARAVDFFGDDNLSPKLFADFAKFEEMEKEYERARAIYKYALEKVPKEEAKELFDSYTQFEKKHGDRDGIEGVINSKRRFQYEEEVKTNPFNYDAWFSLIRLLESESNLERIQDAYERAIANVPPATEKKHWRRYIYLWINYAIHMELTAKDMDKTREVYQACLKLIPHKTFTFGKIWVLAAHFEVRQHNLTAARRLLGQALGRCPKGKLFKCYIDLELQLREFDRCRTLYNKFLEFDSTNCQTWISLAELEAVLGETERALAVFDLAVTQPVLDMPELLWKKYIDYTIELGDIERTRDLYEQLLQRTQHPKVYIAYAEFEKDFGGEDGVEQARHVFETADKEMRKRPDKAERLFLLEAWAKFEQERGTPAELKKVQAKMPRKVKKRRELFAEDGSSEGWEEYFDYIYPDEEGSAPNLKLLEAARKWKLKQQQKEEAAAAAAAAEPSSSVAAAAMAAEEKDAEDEDEE